MESKSLKSKGWWWWLLVFVIAALVAAASLLTLWRNFHHLGSKGHCDSGATIVDKYAAALGIAMQLFDVQKCLCFWKLVSWRIIGLIGEVIRAYKMKMKVIWTYPRGMYDAGN